MNNYQNQQQHQDNSMQMVTFVDPYVYQTLQTVLGKTLVVQTTEGNIRGQLIDVKPDHIVVDVSGSSFFIRIQSIVWVMPQ
ncbi:YuzF family protein [Bacillaceae bacterium IKA-2]|nr:YuzF family protein [Bacillaceae bacterium IKA-2]